ncbi:MAG: NucA/NucB deoxyribonuclease domain-containing protein [Solirubrobacterales bacterium]
MALDRRRHRAVLAHMRRAVRAGWDRVLVLNREGAEERRERLLDEDRYPTREGMDRDEWPMAFARKTWRAHVAYVPSRQNRSAGTIIGNALRPYCNGTTFRVVARRLPA